MRTVEVCLYKFDELSEQAQRKALDNYEVETQFYWNEAHETVKKFHDLFGTKEGIHSWLDIRTGHIDSDIMELSGFRLQKYIWNNFGDELFTRKYLKDGGLFDAKKPNHRMRKQYQITTKCPNQGKFSSSFYSNIQKDNCCVLTGICYDDDMLSPIYKFLKMRDFEKSPCFEGLLEECTEALRKSLENEDEYRNSDEAKTEEIEANEYEFDEDGEME